MRRPLLAIAFLALTAVIFSAPTACYLSRGAWEEAKILSRRQPIAEIVKDPRTSPAERAKLAVVLAVREYAKDSLKLRTKDSFTTYSRLDHDTLVLVLSAAYRDTLKAYTWWFPIVGTVPYKGYFDFNAARSEQRKFESEGFDTYLRPSDAFSTLGWFNDPLLNTSLRRDSVDLANTVIHELTHNTFYAPSQVAFNESFAMFVGAHGAAAFFRARGSDSAARISELRWADDKVLGSFWTSLIKTLDSAYRMHPASKAERIAARDTVYARARLALVNDVAPRLKTISPLYAERVQLDNAALLARRVYASDLQVFDDLYAREGFDLRRSIGRIIALARSKPKDPFGAVRAWVRENP